MTRRTNKITQEHWDEIRKAVTENPNAPLAMIADFYQVSISTVAKAKRQTWEEHKAEKARELDRWRKSRTDTEKAVAEPVAEQMQMEPQEACQGVEIAFLGGNVERYNADEVVFWDEVTHFEKGAVTCLDVRGTINDNKIIVNWNCVKSVRGLK